jgi:Zn-dependent protease/CBS domain-containing protein
MRWSITIGRFGGTSVKVHATFILFLAWIGFSAWQRQGAVAARDSVMFMAFIFACVVLHEFGHILVARHFGIATPEVVLLPIGGMANMQAMPEKPSQELAVAIAGPAVNIAIAIVLLALLGEIKPDYLTRLDDPRVSLFERLAAANIFLAVFNLVPAFPMDGGRVLRAILAMKLGKSRATHIAASIGQALAFVFGFLGLFGNPLLLFIAIFIYIAAAGEAQMTAFHESARSLLVADAMETRFATLPLDARLSDAVDVLLASAQHELPVIDAFGKPAGILSREEIIRALKDRDSAAPIADLMRAPVETLRETTPLEEALDRLNQGGTAAVCVANREGVLVGILTRQNLAEIMMIRSIRPQWRFQRVGSSKGFP